MYYSSYHNSLALDSRSAKIGKSLPFQVLLSVPFTRMHSNLQEHYNNKKYGY